MGAEAGNGDFLKSVRAAFSSWWTVLGIVAASVSGFNLLRNGLKIDLASVVAEIVRAYQALVHFPVLWLIALVHWPHPPAWIIDAAALWFLSGGVLFRTFGRLRRSDLEIQRHSLANERQGLTDTETEMNAPDRTGRRKVHVLRRNLALQGVVGPLLGVVAALVWPITIFNLLQRPVVVARV